MPESWSLKIDRAEKHLAELRLGVESYPQQRPFKAVRQRGGPRCREHTDCWRYNLQITTQPGPDLAIIAGDVLHNARSGLDHVAVALVPKSRRRSAAFPIELEDIWAKTGPRWWRRFAVRDPQRRRRFETAIEGMPEQAVEIIKKVQPYSRGDQGPVNNLYLLSRLENADKHRELIPFAAGLNDTVSTVRARGQTLDLVMPDLPDGRTFVADGKQVAHFGYPVPPGAQPLQEVEVTVDIRGTLLVAVPIDEKVSRTGELPRYMPLLSLLDTIISQIREHIFPALEPYVRT